MNRRTILRALTLAGMTSTFCLLTIPATAADAPHPRAATNPFAAHNAYTWRLYPGDRLGRAIAAGLKHIEIDVSYDAQRQAVIVTHDDKPRGNEPELEVFLKPVWEYFAAAPGDGYTLIIDFKVAVPEASRRVGQIVAPHAALLSSLPKAGGPFHAGKATVCLTGTTVAHQQYAESVPADGDYLAFGDVGGGAGKSNAADYVPNEPAGFVRFVTLEKGAFRPAAGEAGLSVERMRAVLTKAEKLGYRVRVYTLNPPKKEGEYNLAEWKSCTAAGMHMISTDAYELARDWWNAGAE